MALSLRRKITLGFLVLLAVMISTVILTYGIVYKIEQKVVFVEIIDDFFNTTLEVRRSEKNYFLYGQEKDYEENLLHWGKLNLILQEHTEEFRRLLGPTGPGMLAGRLVDYQGVLQSWHDRAEDLETVFPKAEKMLLAKQIREAGKNLTDFAQQTSRAERKSIQTMLQTTRSVLALSIVVLFILSMAITSIMGRKVVRSLKVLENYTRQIVQGAMETMQPKAAEPEINSLIAAMNRMVNELKSRQQQLVQSEKLAALGILLSGVAHELNNPLSNISSSAQILVEELEEGDPEYQKILVSQIESQADKARDIVRTLLEFSRLKDFHKEKLRLSKLIEETLVLIRGQLPAAVEITVDLPTDLVISADKQRLQQVLINLLTNALDVLDADGHIWVYARENNSVDQPGEVEIMIEDNGPGIDPEHQLRIFDPFFTTKDVGRGSGLGLSICHDIINRHGGSISVDSRPGYGTTFIITLPAQ